MQCLDSRWQHCAAVIINSFIACQCMLPEGTTWMFSTTLIIKVDFALKIMLQLFWWTQLISLFVGSMLHMKFLSSKWNVGQNWIIYRLAGFMSLDTGWCLKSPLVLDLGNCRLVFVLADHDGLQHFQTLLTFSNLTQIYRSTDT